MELKRQIINIIVLFTFLSAAALVYLIYRGNPQAQFIIVLLAVVSYISWGVWHHSHDEGYNKNTYLEYILLGLMVILLFYFRLLF